MNKAYGAGRFVRWLFMTRAGTICLGLGIMLSILAYHVPDLMSNLIRDVEASKPNPRPTGEVTSGHILAFVVKAENGDPIRLIDCEGYSKCYDKDADSYCLAPCFTLDTPKRAYDPKTFLASEYRQRIWTKVPYQDLDERTQAFLTNFCEQGIQIWDIETKDPLPLCGNHQWY
jgi:hypothetical protein